MSHPTIRYNAQHKELILAHCHYVSMPPEIMDAFGECTEYLDCSHNRIFNLSYLYEFTNLKYLILDHNRLYEAHFNQMQWSMPKVKLLMLNRNELMDLHKTIQLLVSIFPNLEYLSLHGNPICPDELELQPFCEYVDYEYEYYRSQISGAFKKLKFLDHYELQRNYCETTPHSAIAREDQKFSKLLFWLRFKNSMSNNNTQFLHPKVPRLNFSNLNFGRRFKLRLHELIQTEESEGDCNITDKDL